MGVILESNDSIGPVWPLLYSSLVSYLLRANTKAGDSAKQVIDQHFPALCIGYTFSCAWQQ